MYNPVLTPHLYILLQYFDEIYWEKIDTKGKGQIGIFCKKKNSTKKTRRGGGGGGHRYLINTEM